jgi:hypothetical protein
MKVTSTFTKKDEKLLARLKESAARYRYAPEALIKVGEDAAEFERNALIPVFGPFPQTIEEVPIDVETLGTWPDWVAEIVPLGSKWERLHWPDGSVTIRLVNPGGQVLAAKSNPANREARGLAH